MKKYFFFILIISVWMNSAAQVGINTDGSTPNVSSMLDVKSTTKGVLVPRMTTAQRDAISSPATGLLIFCTTNNQYYTNKGTPTTPNWVMVSSQWLSSGTSIYYTDGMVGIGTTSPQQRLHVEGKIVAEWGSTTSASYRFGDGSENTGLSSASFNTISFVNNGILSVNIDALGRMGVGTSSPSSSAQLEVTSTTRGFLPPRMTTTQMNAISSPQAGLIVFNTSLNTLFWYNGTTWKTMSMNNDRESCGSVIYSGKTYTTVIIGTQCWMKENLNVGTAISGTQNQANNGSIEKYCYDNNSANCAIYGGLYQWDEMMQYTTIGGAQGICPSGWHIPTDAEWTTLTTYLGGESVAGGKMKEAGTTHWQSPNTGATNSSGFTALPGGYRSNFSSFSLLTLYSYFWSSSQDGASNAWIWRLDFDYEDVTKGSDLKTYGFSCRCVKD